MRRTWIILGSGASLLACAVLLSGCAPRPGAVESQARADEAMPVRTIHEVQTTRNIAYYQGADADPIKHRLDLYVPRGEKDRPVVLFLHGGAWVFGDKDFFGVYEALGKMFARHGVVAAVASYRLSPRVQHPEHVKDAARAFVWVHDNIARHGGRADRIFLCGHSAGGHLVSLLATDESYLKAEGRSLKDIQGVLPISGVYEIPDGLFQNAFGKDAEVHRQASPLTHVHAGCPSFLVLYADKDYPFCDAASEKFARALKAKKVAARTQVIKERNHFDIIGKATHDDDPCAQALLDFIAQHSGR
jgi:acetyl esterase/lipase